MSIRHNGREDRDSCANAPRDQGPSQAKAPNICVYGNPSRPRERESLDLSRKRAEKPSPKSSSGGSRCRYVRAGRQPTARERAHVPLASVAQPSRLDPWEPQGTASGEVATRLLRGGIFRTAGSHLVTNPWRLSESILNKLSSSLRGVPHRAHHA